MATEASVIIGAILAGDADNNLEGVVAACRDRIKMLARTNYHLLKVGDRVRLVGGQQYLQGVEGTVTRKLKSKVEVDLDEQRGRFHKGVQCPVELLQKLS